MSSRILVYLSIATLFASCKGEKETPPPQNAETVKYKRFVSYSSFNDKPDLHLEAASHKGVGPLTSRNDTVKYAEQLVKLPMELDMYKMDKLTHSMPMLVSDASRLLVQIGSNFKDSLRSKKMPPYKLIVTSVTRTHEDVKALSKRNINAIDNSVHCYATTFDISWRRFEKIGPPGDDDVSPDRLKYVLAQVIHDLRERGRCYVVHERKQACFHVTVR